MSRFTRRNFLAALAMGVGAVMALPPVAAFAESPFKPEAGKGLIVFYRMGGAADSLRFDIKDGSGAVVAHMKRGAVVPVSLKPGSHYFVVTDANKTEGTIKLKAGQVIYVRNFFSAATFSGKLQL